MGQGLVCETCGFLDNRSEASFKTWLLCRSFMARQLQLSAFEAQEVVMVVTILFTFIQMSSDLPAGVVCGPQAKTPDPVVEVKAITSDSSVQPVDTNVPKDEVKKEITHNWEIAKNSFGYLHLYLDGVPVRRTGSKEDSRRFLEELKVRLSKKINELDQQDGASDWSLHKNSFSLVYWTYKGMKIGDAKEDLEDILSIRRSFQTRLAKLDKQADAADWQFSKNVHGYYYWYYKGRLATKEGFKSVSAAIASRENYGKHNSIDSKE